MNKHPNPVGKSDNGIGQQPVAQLPFGYAALLDDLKRRIREARVKAGLSVNRELIRLHWEVGKSILEREKSSRWGDKVLDKLSTDLHREFPDMKGFSRTNLKYMRMFAQAYPEFSQQPVDQLPWGHNTVLITKVKDLKERLWYIQQTIEHGWSRAVLVHQIESKLYKRQGKAFTNFEQALPTPQSDLARELIKDPYNLDFLGFSDPISERELEQTILDHLRDFLLELGKGFSFVGSQYHLEVGGQDYYPDLLFYNFILRAFVVIDLKVEAFKPEFAGKMNFYLNAIDELMRHPDDQPPIGLILCKERNRVTVEFSLRGMNQPMGVSQYQLLPKDVRDTLPSPEQWEAELESLETEEQDAGNNAD
jgi:predicted nuclease of restriction endonuclease-like (RecB) superfamily